MKSVSKKNIKNFVLFVGFVVSLSAVMAAEPCVLPFHHMIHYAHNPDKPDDIMATYLRVDSTRQAAPTYYEYGGYMRNMTVRGTFAFIHQNWVKKDGPAGVLTDNHWFNTYSKNYIGGLPSVPLRKPPPAEPNEPVIDGTVDASILPVIMDAISRGLDLKMPVYVTPTGKKFHDESCRYAGTADKITLIEAFLQKKEPCGVCQPIGKENEDD